MLTVKQLKEVLAEYDDNLIVIMSKDAEGNHYSPIAAEAPAGDGLYEPDTTWSGDFCSGEDMEGQPANALCLWPTN